MRTSATPRALRSWPGILLAVSCGTALVVFVAFVAQFFPNQRGALGHDYQLFVPWLLAGKFWQVTNGVFTPAPFTPAFCGGVPLLFNPQSIYYSLPQLLALVTGPVNAFLATTIIFGLIGCAGMYGVARLFRLSVPASLMAAGLFLLNGFFIYRMAVGHVTYHAVMLVPWLTIVLLSDARYSWQGAAMRIAGTALVVAYFFYSGATNVILPASLAVLLLWMLYRLLGHAAPCFIRYGVMGALLGVALSAYKLVPALVFSSYVTRPEALQLAHQLFRLVGALGVGLFAPQILPLLLDETSPVGRHEMEYGVGLVPLIALVVAIVQAARSGDLRSSWGTIRRRRARRWLFGLVALLALAVLVNYDAPGMRAMLLHIPIVKMMSLLIRLWFAFIPLLCIAAGLALDYLIQTADVRRAVAGAALMSTALQLLATNVDFYARQGYDPRFAEEISGRLAAGGGVPAISWVGDPRSRRPPGSGAAFLGSRNDSLVIGVSDLPCYEPMFGYFLENFPAKALDAGRALDKSGQALRLRNPACYVFPEANHCAPGDGFAPNQLDAALAFSQYRPFRYAVPAWMNEATFATLFAGLMTLAGLLVGVIDIVRRGRRTGRVSTSPSARPRHWGDRG